MKKIFLLTILIFSFCFFCGTRSNASTDFSSNNKPDSTDSDWQQLADDLEVLKERLQFKEGAFEKWQKIPNDRQLAVMDAWVAFAVPYLEAEMLLIEDEQVRSDGVLYMGWLTGEKEAAGEWTNLPNDRKNAVWGARNKADIKALGVLINRLRGN